MEIRERTIDEIKKLDSNSLSTLYDIVLAMRKEHNGNSKSPSSRYLNVRNSLKNVRGSLSRDIMIARQDRL